jgi:hypothetical protein
MTVAGPAATVASAADPHVAAGTTVTVPDAIGADPARLANRAPVKHGPSTAIDPNRAIAGTRAARIPAVSAIGIDVAAATGTAAQHARRAPTSGAAVTRIGNGRHGTAATSARAVPTIRDGVTTGPAINGPAMTAVKRADRLRTDRGTTGHEKTGHEKTGHEKTGHEKTGHARTGRDTTRLGRPRIAHRALRNSTRRSARGTSTRRYAPS